MKLPIGWEASSNEPLAVLHRFTRQPSNIVYRVNAHSLQTDIQLQYEESDTRPPSYKCIKSPDYFSGDNGMCLLGFHAT